MLHSSARRFSTGVPVRAARQPAGSARATWAVLVVAFLTFCASSSTTACHVTERSSASSRGSRAYVLSTTSCPAAWSASRRLARPAPWWTSSRKAGANRSSSRRQLPTTEVGQTIKVGPRRAAAGASPPPSACLRRSRSAMTWTVLPRPMSSARQAPRP